MVYTMQLSDKSGGIVTSDASVLVDFWYYPDLDNGLWTNDWQARTVGYLTSNSGNWASIGTTQWMAGPDDSGAPNTLTLMGIPYMGKLPALKVGNSGDAMNDTSGGGKLGSLITWTCVLIT